MQRMDIIDVRKGAVVSVAYWDKAAKKLHYQTAHLNAQQAESLAEELRQKHYQYNGGSGMFSGALVYQFTK